MKTKAKRAPLDGETLRRKYRARAARIRRARRDLGWVAREFDQSLVADLAAILARELKQLEGLAP